MVKSFLYARTGWSSATPEAAADMCVPTTETRGHQSQRKVTDVIKRRYNLLEWISCTDPEGCRNCVLGYHVCRLVYHSPNMLFWTFSLVALHLQEGNLFSQAKLSCWYFHTFHQERNRAKGRYFGATLGWNQPFLSDYLGLRLLPFCNNP